MYSSNLENSLILPDIVDQMTNYVSLQPDIDETKIKAAAIIAQRIDIQKVIGKLNIERCIESSDTYDAELKALIVPPLCYYTYSRLLKGFQGTFTDSGYSTDQEAEERNTAKSVSNEMSAIAETFMSDVIDFLEDEEDPVVDETKLVSRIRVIGGVERRASN